MREVNPGGCQPEYNPAPQKKRKLKNHGRFFVFLILLAVFVWMIITFLVSLSTGQKFSMLGAASQPVRNIVVAGVDEGGYRTDLILLCQINRYTNELTIVQIPRDTKIQNNRNDKKINSAFFSGFDCMSNEINQVTGIKPDGYIMVSFDGFNDIVDALGGVTVDVPIRMNYTDPVQNLVIDLQPGKQKLDGEHAQMFMRFRKNNDGTGYADGDMGRIDTQKLLYSAVIKKIKSPAGIVRLPAVLVAVKKHTKTNLGSELTGVLRDMVACSSNVKFYTLPGGGKYIGGVSYFVCDQNAANEMISQNFVK